MSVRVCGFRDKTPDNATIINTTSRSKNWTRALSPFFLGPVDLYDGLTARNVENAWQNAKTYPEHDAGGVPNEAYWEWAKKGWADTRAHRYPMGKGAKPLYSWWDGEALGYIEARKRIYVPLYTQAVIKTAAFELLKQKLQEATDAGEDLWLWDFDGYDHVAKDMSLDEVLNYERKKMGHAFVLAMLLEDK